MGAVVGDQFRAALQVLADLATSSGTGPLPPLAVPLEWFRWVPPCEELFEPSAVAPATTVEAVLELLGSRGPIPSITIERGFAERLAGVDQVRASAHAVRLGWLFVAGSFEEGGRRRRVFHPLVSLPVRVVRPPLTSSARVVAVGDVELSSLIPSEARRRLEQGIQFGGGALQGGRGVSVSPKLLGRLTKLERFALEAARAAGLPADRLVPVDGKPEDLMDEPVLSVVAGYGLFVTDSTRDVSQATTLRRWAHAEVPTTTAFHAVYGLVATRGAAGADDEPVDGPLVLSPSQAEAVQRSRRELVTTVAGSPGTGKSHTIAAIACDAVARGERVLVAARSTATVDALVELLERTPGPDPVVFGSTERRAMLAARLAAGRAAPLDATAIEHAVAARDAALAGRDAARAAVMTGLFSELAWTSAMESHGESWALAPGLLEPDVDVALIRALFNEASSEGGGWWRRRRRRRAWVELLARGRADPGVSIVAVGAVVAIAEARAAARVLDRDGGLDLDAEWARLEALDEAARTAVGAWLAVDARSPRRINQATLGAVSGLATALRSGRAARREQLARLDTAALTTAYPLWIGTLDDIDDLLPATPAAFELVLLDEASSIDQPAAAAALLRARRTVIVGDPRQLRHVSFVGDDAIATSVNRHGLSGSDVEPRLDVRRNSIFDTAAAVAPVTTLGEHYRSDPHLVEFVTRRLYDGTVSVATHSPLTDHRDCVDAVRVDGTAVDGVVRAELDEVLRALRRADERGERSVGVVTPFRAQADALERAILASFSADQLERMDLRVGTVHAFQGIERDLVLCSLAITADSGVGRWRYAQDPHLLTVFLTRARHRLVFVYSTDSPPDGLLAEYLAGSDEPPGPAHGASEPGRWCRLVTEQLASAGFRLASAYPTGRHVIDAVLLDAATPTAIITGVHPGGPDAHIDRHLALRRRGWHIHEVFESRWSAQLALLAVQLHDHVAT